MKSISFFKSYFVSFLLLCSLACSKKWTSKDLWGEWVTVSWNKKLSGETIPDQINLNFFTNQTFEVERNSISNLGNYINGSDQFIIPGQGREDIHANIVLLNKDSLKLELINEGIVEHLLLVRKGCACLNLSYQ